MDAVITFFQLILSYIYSLIGDLLNWIHPLDPGVPGPYDPLNPPDFAKPILYLYPETETDVDVKLNFDGKLTVSYPAYGDGWNVRAYPDGHLVNKADGREYSYLFWEGLGDNLQWNLSEGWCVPGGDTAAFLQEKLAALGLTPKEYNEFIVYWLPLMQDNAYNLVTFQWTEYEKAAPLVVNPAPDSTLRVFMVYKPLTAPVAVPAPAERPAFDRKGFTLVEWGGTQV
ncbi:MAG: hypothetical protein LBN05_03755 [Oscillospiraceae bacterium]|jgi:hypothetical protein|nr:hypothetical protein [Oscillospiraceae bacterium]